MTLRVFLTLLVFFVYAATGGPAFAGVWEHYQGTRAEHRARNQELLRNFSTGKISAQDLQNAWKEMHDEAAVEARQVADEWAGKSVNLAGTGTQEEQEPGPAVISPPVQEPSNPAVTAPVRDSASETGERTPSTTPGLPKYPNVTLKWGVLELSLLTMEEIQNEAIPHNWQEQAKPTAQGRNNFEGVREIESNLQSTERELDEAQGVYTGALHEYGEERNSLQQDKHEDRPGIYNGRFIHIFLMSQLALIYLIYLIRIRWMLLYMLYNPAFSLLIASLSPFGISPFAHFSLQHLGRELLFGENVEQKNSW